MQNFIDWFSPLNSIIENGDGHISARIAHQPGWTNIHVIAANGVSDLQEI